MFSEIMERFAERSPCSVMVRGILENLLRPEKIDAIFEKVAADQYTRSLLFSSVVDLMGLVVCKIRPSIHAAYEARREQIGVSLTAVYNKLNGLEPAVVAALVRNTGRDAAAVIDATGGALAELLPGYAVRVLDGNHFPATEHRLAELRRTREGPLPGQALVVLDPARMLVTDIIPCEDGHAQERSLLDQVLEQVRSREVWLGDRNFCTTRFLFGIAARSACFLIRQHASTLTWELVGAKRRVGRCESGTVYEQAIRLRNDDELLTARRVTLVLDEATRDGDQEIHVLTNLPERAASAVKVAELYRQRWTIEGVFQVLTQALHSEIRTLGYPRAALFAFAVSLVAFNVHSVTTAALRAVHGADKVEDEVSTYQVTTEVAAVSAGMDLAVPAEDWSVFQHQTPAGLAQTLRRLARRVDLRVFRKHKRGPKKPRPARKSGAINHHVSTARLLAACRSTKRAP
jgi:IS4 transposase